MERRPRFKVYSKDQEAEVDHAIPRLVVQRVIHRSFSDSKEDPFSAGWTESFLVVGWPSPCLRNKRVALTTLPRRFSFSGNVVHVVISNTTNLKDLDGKSKLIT